MKLRELRASGHAPSLVAAFLHFDISFMVWVILGALMPFLAADPVLTGANLAVVPTASIQQGGQYTLLIKGPDPAKGQPGNVYNVLIKPGDPSTATRASTRPVESYVLDNRNPASLKSLNDRSRLIRVHLLAASHGNPNETVLPLKPLSALHATNKPFQVVANGWPASIRLGLVGLPLLAAAFWRILLGILSDRFGSKRVGVVSLLVTLLPLGLAWKLGDSLGMLQLIGFFLGIAGASFAISLPLASRWYPPHLQGVVMGIAGAGNSGTVLATLFAPLLAKTFGWHAVFGLLAIPVGLTLVAFLLLAKDPPGRAESRPLKEYSGVFASADCWWFCLLYLVTFGGFVGMSSFFNSFFVDQFDIPKATVGVWTAPFIVAGSLLRPVGGFLADRVGGIKTLTMLYATILVSALGVGIELHSLPVTATLLLVMMAALGMGNGSVFQLVPQRFRHQIGIVTGVVGAAGGVGGYYLNFALGHLKDSTGTYASGFFAFAAMSLLALVALLLLTSRWTRTWSSAGGKALTAGTEPTRLYPGTAVS